VLNLFLVSIAFFFLNCGDGGTDTQEIKANFVSSDTLKVATGADVLFNSDFETLRNLRVGLVTNHTAKLRDGHLIDHLVEAEEVQLAALFAPEHGLRDMADAGEHIESGVDPVSGVTIHSLYTGKTRRPSQESLSDLDLLLFDIQDIGARFYTYISTMGMAMQSAAEAGIPFLVLDRPNVLGGEQVDGYVLDPEFSSTVGFYPIPIMHGLTVGELAEMIKGEQLLDGLDGLDLRVVKMENWKREMFFDDTGLPWTKTSPNIPDIETALLYPGICLFEGTSASEGRGTREPFKLIGQSNLDTDLILRNLEKKNLPGVAFSAEAFKPVSIDGMSKYPKLQDQDLKGIRIGVTDKEIMRPLEVGIHLLYEAYQSMEGKRKIAFLNKEWLGKLTGSDRFYESLKNGSTPEEILISWNDELEEFKETRQKYLLY